MKYRKKTEIVDAFIFSANSSEDYPEWFNAAINQGAAELFICPCEACREYNRKEIIGCFIQTFEGMRRCVIGDYIIHNVFGRLYSYKPIEFNNTYIEVSDESIQGDKE